MKLNYRQKLFFAFGLVFFVFASGVAVFEQSREKRSKTRLLEEKLETYTDLVHLWLVEKRDQSTKNINTIHSLLPGEVRITLINNNGEVLFDNSISNYQQLQNHVKREEVAVASKTGKGSYIRLSDSNNQKYLYFAKRYGDNYIRAALPYNIQLQQFIASDNAALYFLILFFLIFLFIIHFTTRQLGKSVHQLRDFIIHADENELKPLRFPQDELGEIGKRIADNFYRLKESRQNAYSEKQKLLQHIQILGEGICFISADNSVAFHNGLFLQYLNTITDEATSEATSVLTDNNFVEVQKFIASKKTHYYEEKISRQGKTFSVRANIFDDRSAEIVISDITKQEKTRLLKQEMTGNITHELRTPVTSIRGYLETVLTQNLEDEKLLYFINKAHLQTVALSDIIQDISLISKMEEAPTMFRKEKTDIVSILQRLHEDVEPELSSKQMQLNWNLPPKLVIEGNTSLIYALFRNLTDNAVRYAGNNTSINITTYNEDADYLYFIFYDTGEGIKDESHLNRLFERFYRLSEGRTRNTGGTGLGLSIVKNAVLFHKGTITVKNRKEGGLEFLFTLKKTCQVKKSMDE